MKYIDEFREKDILKKLSFKIKKAVDKADTYNFMEVCGTHTMNIFRFGLKEMLPGNIRLISGPGCPVCVTPIKSIDGILAYSGLKDTIIVTFGDMVRVPGSRTSLVNKKAEGAKVKVVYSPEEAIEIADLNPKKTVILIGIGFETTAPLFAEVLLEARQKNINNLFVLSLHKTLPEALLALLQDKDIEIDGFILPGHVSAIIGSRPYEFIPEEFGVRCVIAGFEPVDIMEGILNLVKQRTPTVKIQYNRVVKRDGNRLARRIMNKVFEKCDSEWRGLGVIGNSGLKIRKEFRQFDAEEKYAIHGTPHAVRTTHDARRNLLYNRCICGEVLKGKKEPTDCALFGNSCTPAKPVGACMVSSEGACAAYYKYKK